MIKRNRLTAAERYILAADEVDKLPKPPIRLNTMSVRGELAQQLACIGAPLLRASLGNEVDVGGWDYAADNVSTGALFAFGVLRKAIEPAYRRYGVENSRIFPWDRETGSVSHNLGGGESAHPKPYIVPSKTYALGEEREDFWLALRVGVASGIALTHDTSRSITKATRGVEWKAQATATYVALGNAATIAQTIVDANVQTLTSAMDGLPAGGFPVTIQPVESGSENEQELIWVGDI